ncbi:hypothetical protein BKA70DRAFT_1502678 [Coprinopsis sp. MPI-PUGE-AT-0042]|nr:hypothetical protein BKA70DRAFT_1502678 [Coprinopsis sp. MPI-PUGE-AT-0042]
MVAQVKKRSIKRLCLGHPHVLHRTRITLMFFRTKPAFALALVLSLIKLAVAVALPRPFPLTLALKFEALLASTTSWGSNGAGWQGSRECLGTACQSLQARRRYDESCAGMDPPGSLTNMDEEAVDSASNQPEHEHSNSDPHPQQDAPNLLDALPLTKEVDSPPAEDAVDGDRDLPAPWRTRKSDENPVSLIENGRKSVQYARNLGAGGSSGTDTK